MSFVSMTGLALIGFVSLDTDIRTESASVSPQVNVSVPQLPQTWQTSYETARKMAAKNKLPLLLHFDATWCGACVRMERDVLQRPEVRSLLGREVVGVKIDADQHKHLISEFGISTLPTEVVVYADGTRGSRHVGATSLSSYVSRLKGIGGSNRAVVARTVSEKPSPKAEEARSVRSCLIVRHDGKMVGVGGFSPVALTEARSWRKGTSLFRHSHEGVCYFLQTEEERVKFSKDPAKYIPHLHGCDLVELFNENRATAGAIEYGAFYKGQVFFFASLENRNRFENNPTWYTGVMTDARTANDEMFPFLSREPLNN